MSSLRAICSFLLILALTTSAAPVEKAPGDSSSVNEVKKEEELQSLLQLADKESGRSDVTVHEEHRQHVHEVNGQKVEVDTARKTVSNTKTGQVISDVKQEVSKSDQDAHPEVEVKTEVDVPAEGVHETIVQSGAEAEQEVENAEAEAEAEAEEEIEFSPEAVAEYLYQTGDFNRFYAALAQLVNASVMTEEEAQGYSQMVALEYDRMQMEDFENNILVQRRASSPLMEQYPVMEAPSDLYPLPMEAGALEAEAAAEAEGYPFPMRLDSPEDLYALERGLPSSSAAAAAAAGYAGAPALAPASAPQMIEEEFDPYELLYSLWNEAYGTGDARAEELVSELFDKVRDDNDPDDEGQVRDILLDLIANSETDEEEDEEMVPPQARQGESLYGWQPIVDVQPAPVQPLESMQPMMGDASGVVSAQAQQPMGKAALVSAEAQQPMAEDEEAANELMLQGAAQKRAAEEPTLDKDSKLPEQPQAGEDSSQGNHEDDNSNSNNNSNSNAEAQPEEGSSENQKEEGKAAKGEEKEEEEELKEEKQAEAPLPTPAAAAASVAKRAAKTV